MLERRRFKQQLSLEDGLAAFAKTAREVAALLPPGAEKDEMLRKASRADASEAAMRPGPASPRPDRSSSLPANLPAVQKDLRLLLTKGTRVQRCPDCGQPDAMHDVETARRLNGELRQMK